MAKKRTKQRVYYVKTSDEKIFETSLEMAKFYNQVVDKDSKIYSLGLDDSHFYNKNWQSLLTDRHKFGTRSHGETATTNFFSCDIPDLQALMNTLDMANEAINEAVREGIHAGADIILAEQKRLISSHDVGKRLSKALKKGRIYTTKKGTVGITTGYQEDSFKVGMGDKYWQKESDGIIGLTYEFGRPGQSPQRSGETMKQKRKRRKKVPVSSKRKNAKGWKYSEAEPTEVTIKKGAIAPVPHVRRGFDNKVEAAADAAVNIVVQALEKVWEGEVMRK